MKKFFLLAMTCTLIGCSTTKETRRDIASLSGNCSVEKHPHKNQYQIMVDGKAYTNEFHSEHTAWNRVKRFQQSGTCN